MRTTLQLTLTAAAIGLALVACGEGTAPASEQAQVLDAETAQLGAMVDSDYGAPGAAATTASAGPLGGGTEAALATTGGDTAPTFWGRLRVVPGGPRPIYHRDVTIQGDTARVQHDITFEGVLLVDTSADGTFNPTTKPLADRMTQHAVLVRDGARPHGWRVVAVSPQDWTVVDPSRQTVAVTDVQVYRNDTLLVEVTDPAGLLDVVSRIPRFHVGDTVKVVAAVTNGTASGFTPRPSCSCTCATRIASAPAGAGCPWLTMATVPMSARGSCAAPVSTASPWTRSTRPRCSSGRRTTTGRT
jgi:hypothetical protein